MKYRMTDIQNFFATSSCSTMAEAARKLEISQPALSESIKRLETDARFRLFYRSRSGIQLTPEGRLFLGRTREVLNAVQNLENTSETTPVFGGRSISIGCHPTVASYCLPKALSVLEKKAPDYQVSLRHGLSRQIQFEIQRGTIDIGVIVNAVPVPDLIISELASDTVAIWESRDRCAEVVICNPDLFQTQAILRKWRAHPPKTIFTESLELICQLTSQGVGYGIIPQRAVQISARKLRKLTSLPSHRDEISLVYRPEFGKTNAERLVIEALKSSLA